jgi:hypothetical protein
MTTTVPVAHTAAVAAALDLVDGANARVLRAMTDEAHRGDLRFARIARTAAESALDSLVDSAHELLAHDQDAINRWAEDVVALRK